MATRIQVRRDTAANWTTNNPTLADGEIGFETNSGKFKIGNGSSTWSVLDYFLDSSDLLAYLTTASAASTYLTQASASTTYATKAELSNIDLSSASAAAVAAIVDSAPATLNTLNELAAALGDDANFASTVTTALGNKLNTSTASSTYLTQASASTTYATIGSGGGSSGSAGLIAHLAADNLPNAINTISRVVANSSLTINSGTLYLSHFTPQVNLTVGRISMQPINYPSSNPTYAKLCIYSIAEDNVTMTLIGSTADLGGTHFFRGNSIETQLFTSSVNLIAGQRYAAGFLTVGATGTGSLKAATNGQNGSGMIDLFPIISTQWTSQSVLPNSLTIPTGYSPVKFLSSPWFYLAP
jgi:hypothetical protein